MEALLINGLLAFVAGILLNFTPCVLPVIPLKIKAVLSEIKGDLQPRLLAAGSLLSGTLVFFLILGGATAFLGLTWGALFQSKVFLSVLSAFLFFSAVATFADWTLHLPQLFYRVPIHRYVGAFLTGTLAGILSTPCSGPFLGSVLAYAVTQSPVVIMLLFISIGLGLAFPYVLILIWPGLLARLSYARPWAIHVKHILGFILFAGAIFFSQALIPKSYHSLLWISFYASVPLWALIMLRRAKVWSEKLIPTGIFAVALIGVGLIFFARPANQLEWQELTQEASQGKLAQGHPVLLEFTAAWCLNCRYLEKTAYADKGVIQVAKQVNLIPYRIDMTHFDDWKVTLLESYGGTALPYAVLIDKSGTVIHRFSGMFSAQTLEKAIHQVGQHLSLTGFLWKPLSTAYITGKDSSGVFVVTNDDRLLFHKIK